MCYVNLFHWCRTVLFTYVSVSALCGGVTGKVCAINAECRNDVCKCKSGFHGNGGIQCERMKVILQIVLRLLLTKMLLSTLLIKLIANTEQTIIFKKYTVDLLCCIRYIILGHIGLFVIYYLDDTTYTLSDI